MSMDLDPSANSRASPEDLTQLAELALAVSVNLQPGQALIVTAPLEAASLVRRVTENAYRRGASLVTCVYEHPEMLRAQLEHGCDEALDAAPDWLYQGVAHALERGAAHLAILGPRPELLADMRMDRILRVHRAQHSATAAQRGFFAQAHTNCAAMPFATSTWASTVFPTDSPATAQRRLWSLLMSAAQADAPDPLRALTEHIAALDSRCNTLHTRQLAALRFHDGRTDLTVGLAQNHRWSGGSVLASNGVVHFPAIPAEEIFTAVCPELVDGRLILSRPFTLAGTLVEDLRIDFRAGVIVSISAAKGQEALERLLAIDPGAGRLGEVGLASAHSPLAAIEALHCPALERNAASRVAFGQPSTGNRSRLSSNTTNQSAIHLDCAIGTPGMHVDGIDFTGRVEPIMQNGEFVEAD